MGGGEELLDDEGVVGVLEGVDAGGEGVGGVAGEDGAGGLEDDVAGVVLFVDVVDGDAGGGVAGVEDGLVDVVAVHAFAAVAGEEGGVDVDDAAGVGLEEGGGEAPEEAGEDDEVDAEVAELVEEAGGVEEVVAGDEDGGEVEAPGALEDGGAGVVADDGDDAGHGALLEVEGDVFGVGA